MEENITLFLLDDSHNLIEEKNIPRPKTYDELKLAIKNIFIRPLENYQIFYYNIYNIKKIINNEEEYISVKDILFINELKEKEKEKQEPSIYKLNYDELSESKQDILDEKYNCNICQEIIKGEEQPLFCYQCQKLFHKKCLEDWNNKCTEKNLEFSCPKCKYELPLKDWHKKLNYNDERINEVNLMKEITNKNQKNKELERELNIIKSDSYDKFKNIYDKVEQINSFFEKNKLDSINIIINDYNQSEIPFKIVEKLNNIEESIKNIEKEYQKEIPIEKLLCKICFEKRISGEITKNKAVGFFCEADKNFPIKYILFTNYNILDEKSIEVGKLIEIEYLTEIGYISKKIEITKKRKVFFDMKLNYTCIEILESDNIKNFFKIDLDIYQNYINFIDKEVMMFDNNFNSKSGKIISIEDNIIKHNISINNQYSGSPLIVKTDKERFILGLFYGEDIYNLANKFNYILENLKSKMKITNNIVSGEKNEITCIYSLEENYYINLIHDYNSFHSIEESNKETKELHIHARFTNKDFYNDKNIELFIDNEKVNFIHNYSRKSPDQKLINVKIKFKKLIQNTSFMFSGCRDLISIDLSSFNTCKVNNMSYMFNECRKLKNANFNFFNTSKVVNMQGMFRSCESLKYLDLSSFKTNKVTNMNDMFESCKSLESINLSSFRTKNVVDMSYMFSFCSSLTSLDLSTFNTSSVRYMNYMFSFCTQLATLDISSFDTTWANIYKIFNFCDSLEKWRIKIKNTNDKLYRMRKIG